MKWFVASLICYGVVAAQHQQPFLAFQQHVPQPVASTSSNVRFPAEPHRELRSAIPQNVQWREPHVQSGDFWQSQPQQFQQFQQPFRPQVQQRIPQQVVHQQQTRSAQEFQAQRTRSAQQFQPQQQRFQLQSQQFQQFWNVPIATTVVPTSQRQVAFHAEPVPVVRQPVPVPEPVLAPVQGQNQNRVPQREAQGFPITRHAPSTEFTPQRPVASTEALPPHIFAPVQHLEREPIAEPVTEIATESESVTDEGEQEIHVDNFRDKPMLLPEAPAIIHAVFDEPTTMEPFQPEAEETSTVDTVDDSTVEEMVGNTVQPLEAAVSTPLSSITTTTEPTTTTTTTEPTTTTTEATSTTTSTTTVATSSRRSYSSKKFGFKPRTTTTEKPELNSLPTRSPNSAFSRFSSGGGYKSNCGCVRMLACQRLQISINRCNESEGFMYCCGTKESKDEPEVKEIKAKGKALEEVPSSTTAASVTSTTEAVTETEAEEVTTIVSEEA